MLGNRFLFVMMLSILLPGLTACNPDTGQSASDRAETVPASGKIYHWKMVTTWPPNFPVFQEGVDKLANDIELMSNGRLRIKVHAADELVPALGVFDAVSQGAVQMGHGAAYYWSGKVPAAQFMSAVPFGMTASGMNAWFYAGGGLELWRDLYKPFNLVPFPVGNTGVQMGGWFNKKINSVQDLQGLKMRIPGLGGKVLSKAGGTSVLMAGGEIYTNLERGAIDATEWVGPFHDLRLGLYRAADYYYYPGWHEPGTVLELIINRQAWESLPPDLQHIVKTAAEAIGSWMYVQFESKNLDALNQLKQAYKVEVLEFPPEVLAELRRMTREVLAEEADKNSDFKRVYEAYEAFRQENDAWKAVSEYAYQRALQAGKTDRAAASGE